MKRRTKRVRRKSVGAAAFNTLHLSKRSKLSCVDSILVTETITAAAGSLSLLSFSSSAEMAVTMATTAHAAAATATQCADLF